MRFSFACIYSRQPRYLLSSRPSLHRLRMFYLRLLVLFKSSSAGLSTRSGHVTTPTLRTVRSTTAWCRRPPLWESALVVVISCVPLLTWEFTAPWHGAPRKSHLRSRAGHHPSRCTIRIGGLLTYAGELVTTCGWDMVAFPTRHRHSPSGEKSKERENEVEADDLAKDKTARS